MMIDGSVRVAIRFDDGRAEQRCGVNQELLHHGAEIALLRDLHRVRQG
jgi:hypothetical protein